VAIGSTGSRTAIVEGRQRSSDGVPSVYFPTRADDETADTVHAQVLHGKRCVGVTVLYKWWCEAARFGYVDA
jgi:hypothetical protein